MRMRRPVLVCLVLAAALLTPRMPLAAQSSSVVTIGLTGEVDSMDWIRSTGSAVGYSLFDALFEGLLKVDPINGNVRPWLATSWRLLDPQTYIFVLRRGVKFHDGAEFTAEDAKFSIDLVISSKSWLLVRIPFVTKVEAIDRYTLSISLSQPDVLIPASIAIIPMYPKAYYERVGTQGFSNNPIGTGPFRFTAWQKGVRIVTDRFNGYWGKKAQIQQVVWRPFVESATRLAALEAGEIDIAVNVPPDDAPRLERRGFTIKSVPLGLSMIIQFKLPADIAQDNPIRHKKVRQALNYAVDKQALLKNVMLGYGRVLEGQIVGSDGFGYNPAIKAYPYDLEKARRLLAEAGYPNGFTIRMDTSEGRYLKHREVSEAVVGQLTKAGVRVQMEVHEWGTFVGKLARTMDVAPLSYIGWVYYPAMDADFALRWFASDFSWKLYANPQFDELFKKQRAETDRTKRQALLGQIMALMHEEAPVIFLFQSPAIYALNPKIKGFVATPDERVRFQELTRAP